MYRIACAFSFFVASLQGERDRYQRLFPPDSIDSTLLGFELCKLRLCSLEWISSQSSQLTFRFSSCIRFVSATSIDYLLMCISSFVTWLTAFEQSARISNNSLCAADSRNSLNSRNHYFFFRRTKFRFPSTVSLPPSHKWRWTLDRQTDHCVNNYKFISHMSLWIP